MTKASIDFLQQHLDDDPLRLLLQQGRHPQVDMRWVAQQIEGRRQAADKWPLLLGCPDYEYPPKLNREQSSSEATARYKASLLPPGGTLADLTGGMGIDTYYFAQRATTVDYYELDPTLAALAERNFAALGQSNIRCHAEDGLIHLEPHDALYLDPARRDTHGQRVQAFEDCTPNLLEHLPRLRSVCRTLLIKASPMIDIRLALEQIGECEVHAVAVKGECKEVLFRTGKPLLHCVDIHPTHTYHDTFSLTDEAHTPLTLCTTLRRYLYEPHAALLKGGAYHQLAQRYGVEQLARHTHLYTSDRLLTHWPGRIFEVLQPVALNAKEVRRLLPDRKAHLLARNYPLTTAQLQQRLHLAEGGTLHLIATTLVDKPIGLLAKRVALDPPQNNGTEHQEANI